MARKHLIKKNICRIIKASDVYFTPVLINKVKAKYLPRAFLVSEVVEVWFIMEVILYGPIWGIGAQCIDRIVVSTMDGEALWRSVHCFFWGGSWIEEDEEVVSREGGRDIVIGLPINGAKGSMTSKSCSKIDLRNGKKQFKKNLNNDFTKWARNENISSYNKKLNVHALAKNCTCPFLKLYNRPLLKYSRSNERIELWWKHGVVHVCPIRDCCSVSYGWGANRVDLFHNKNL